MRHTKIIATVGPASGADDMLDALIAAGTDIFRLNFSHGTQQTQGDTYARVRAAAKRSRREVAILQDLAGPKIRTGTNKGGWPIAVKPGERLLIATGDFPGEPGRLSTTFAGLAHSVRPGDRLLLADGSIELRVDATDGAARSASTRGSTRPACRCRPRRSRRRTPRISASACRSAST